jgi:deoxycytidylate deaminase
VISWFQAVAFKCNLREASHYVEGATAYITRSPYNRCLPLLVAARVARVVYGDYGDAVTRHTSAETGARQMTIAEDAGVELVDGASPTRAVQGVARGERAVGFRL